MQSSNQRLDYRIKYHLFRVVVEMHYVIFPTLQNKYHHKAYNLNDWIQSIYMYIHDTSCSHFYSTSIIALDIYRWVSLGGILLSSQAALSFTFRSHVNQETRQTFSPTSHCKHVLHYKSGLRFDWFYCGLLPVYPLESIHSHGEIMPLAQ